ncbi:short-chain dehydrogenase [Ruegeria marisrubri]|uniref:Short-chain dehydrogenase n=1 Tax=Ruegeria marisrubri TaxID=1685379 RepID=A0A0X3UBM3_9RHOB|nr:SDR family NAD(P)-dependent oxidoreductase [Ruegeria marisrubri]KUJ85488.1 short-chain dehydrogenase [Ruegeria marisrubri]
MFARRTWWIVGASEGLGAALAHLLDAEGARLLLSARNESKLAAVADRLTDARALPMDVTRADSVADAARNVGTVDGLIYCVGLYEPMSARDFAPEAAANMAEANFVGALRVLGHVLPEMVNRGSGRVMLIGSLAGFVGLPGAIGYGASKAALMHLAENMRADLNGTGVVVQRANPGFIRTRLTDKNNFHMPQIMSPEIAAGNVIAALRSGRFSTSFPKPFSLVFALGRHLPLALFQWLLRTK